MGGDGSGRWYRYGKKTTVEECRVLASGDLVRHVGLGPNVRKWSGITWCNACTGEYRSSVGVDVETGDAQGWARLHYTFKSGRNEGQHVDYRVRLVTTCPHFGGLRWWFISPTD